MLSPHLNLITNVTRFVVQIGVHRVMRDVIARNTTPPITLADKAQLFIGASAISGVVTHHTWQHVEPNVAPVVTAIDRVKANIDEYRTKKEQDQA